MAEQFDWKPNNYGPGFVAEMPRDVTLVATPDHTKGVLGDKPRRGTTWRAQASHWDEATTTCSRFGRDEYGVAYKTSKDAMRAAERIYLDATLCDRPHAAVGLTSYRAAGGFGWVMIGAKDTDDAWRQARRSTATPTNLQIWDGQQYVPVD